MVEEETSSLGLRPVLRSFVFWLGGLHIYIPPRYFEISRKRNRAHLSVQIEQLLRYILTRPDSRDVFVAAVKARFISSSVSNYRQGSVTVTRYSLLALLFTRLFHLKTVICPLQVTGVSFVDCERGKGQVRLSLAAMENPLTPVTPGTCKLYLCVQHRCRSAGIHVHYLFVHIDMTILFTATRTVWYPTMCVYDRDIHALY